MSNDMELRFKLVAFVKRLQEDAQDDYACADRMKGFHTAHSEHAAIRYEQAGTTRRNIAHQLEDMLRHEAVNCPAPGDCCSPEDVQ